MGVGIFWWAIKIGGGVGVSVTKHTHMLASTHTHTHTQKQREKMAENIQGLVVYLRHWLLKIQSKWVFS